MDRLRWIAFGLGVAVAPAALLAIVLCVAAPASAWGFALCAGLAATVAGALTAPWRRGRRRGLTRAGLAVLLVVTVLRIALVDGSGHVRLVTIGGGDRWLNRLLDEGDVALGAGRLLSWTGGLSPAEWSTVGPSMRAAYKRMRAAEGSVPSPFLSTWLGRQRPGAFDAVVIEPRAPRTGGAVVFLHGAAGNFVLPCWQFAQTASAAGLLVVCPSVGPRGDWWTDRGLATVRRTLAYLRQRGVERVVLAGLSNGALGASALAPALRSDIAGLILISGVSEDASPPGVPTLLIHGAADERLSAVAARAYAARGGATVEYHELSGGHFILLDRDREVSALLAAWLATAGR